MKQLWAAVLASPAEDAPRLVYADALTERDDPRGEFIVLQCKLAAGRLGPADAKRARARETELLDAHRQEWFGPFEKWLRERDSYALGHVEVRRGFVARCRLMITGPSDLATMFEKAPLIDELELRGDATPTTPRLAQLKRLEAEGECAASMAGAGALLDGLEVLSLVFASFAQPKVALELEALALLETLKVERISTTKVSLPKQLEVLHWTGELQHLLPVLSRGLPSLRSLSLPGVEIDQDFRKLLQSFAPQLEVLAIDGARFGKGQLEALLRTPWPRLKTLDLSNIGLGVDGAKLVAAMKAPKLEALDLTWTRVKDEGAVAVLSSPLLSSLREISLRANKLTAAAVAPVLKRKHQLRLLNLKKNDLGAGELKKLEKALPETRLSR